MDLSDVDRAAMVDMKGVMTWSGFSGDDMADKATVAGSLADLLGVEPTTHPRVLGILNISDFEDAVKVWRVPGPANTDRAPTLAEVGKATLVGAACRSLTGLGELAMLRNEVAALKAAPGASGSTASATSSAATRRIKMSAVISQVDDSEVYMMEEKEIIKCYARYEAVYGLGERPSKDAEPTTEQLSCIGHLLAQGAPPYADFSVFGPFGHRLMKRIKLNGLTIDRDGSLKSMELYGPSNLGIWLSSYTVLQTILIMQDAVDLGHLQKYRAHIERMAERYGARVWSVIYQADVRCRLEHMERIRRTLQNDHDKAKQAGGTTDFDEARPWNLVWMKAASDETFWREEVNEPALLILAKVTQATELVDGDARVNAASAHGDLREVRPTPARLATPQDVDRQRGLRPRNANRTGRVHNIADGKYTHNRTGYKLCAEFQTEQCKDTTQGVWCAHQWDTVHQCNKCLGTHPGARCPHSEMQTPSFVRKSEGKGKGKGKKGKGKRNPY